jgi:hypothetical protein
MEKYPQYHAFRKKGGPCVTTLDDVLNCTFMPKILAWGEGGGGKGGNDEDGEEKKGDEPMEQFMKRSYAWNRKVKCKHC